MYEDAYIYEMSMYGVCFIIGIKSLCVMNLFTFHSVHQDEKFHCQEQEFVIGSSRLEKNFERIESNLTPACQLNQVPHPVFFETPSGIVAAPLPGQLIPMSRFGRASY